MVLYTCVRGIEESERSCIRVLGVSRKVSGLVYVLGVSILSLFLRFPFGFWNFSESGNFFFFISLNVTITKLITRYVFCHPICPPLVVNWVTKKWMICKPTFNKNVCQISITFEILILLYNKTLIVLNFWQVLLVHNIPLFKRKILNRGSYSQKEMCQTSKTVLCYFKKKIKLSSRVKYNIKWYEHMAYICHFEAFNSWLMKHFIN